MKEIARRWVAGWLVLASLAAPGVSHAEYPDRPIRLIVPYQPGGGVDSVARIVGQKLNETFKQPVVIENRPGAGGIVGMQALTRATPDGYTFAMTAQGMAIVPSTTRDLPFDPIRSFKPVAQVIAVPVVVAINRNVRVQNIREFIEYARNNPGKLNVAVSGVGVTELFELTANVKITSVRYSGVAPAVTSVVKGDTDCTIGELTTVKPHVKSGALRVLAVASENRLPEMPEVPTLKESGLPGYVLDIWFGAFLPAGTPDSIVRTLNAALNRVVMIPSVVQSLKAIDAVPVNKTPEEFTAFFYRNLDMWHDVIQRSGYVPE